MVEKLSKYNVEICNCFLGEHMETVESSDGEFFKVEDVEPILNSLQQLKTEIRTIHDSLQNAASENDTECFEDCLVRLRKLSAV